MPGWPTWLIWNLEELQLGRTAMTDAGLKFLSGLTKLKRVGTHETKVTDEGRRQLRAMIPQIDL